MRWIGSRTALIGALLVGSAGIAWLMGGDILVQPTPPVGKWHAASPRAPAVDPVDAQIAALEAIGYVSGSEEISAAQMITRADPARFVPGLNLFYSQHAPEAYLVDMDGRELHRWALSLDETWPEIEEQVSPERAPHWRRVHLGENGDLYTIFEGRGLLRLDADSRLVWAVRNRAHHDLHRYPDGRIAVLTRKAHVVPRVSETEAILEDFIQVLDADGHTLRSVSLLRAFEDSDYAHHWEKRRAEGQVGDIFHTNSLAILDGGAAAHHAAFQAGRALVSMRSIHTIAVVDLDEEKVVWAYEGDFRRQHDPTMLPGGRLMLFDNGPESGDRSRALVFQLPEMAQVWSFPTGDEVLYSGTLGAAQPLPGGNVLITESTGGRGLEVTPEGEVVWELFNPNRAGEDGRYIAAIPEILRLPGLTDLPWRADAPATSSPAERAEGAARPAQTPTTWGPPG